VESVRKSYSSCIIDFLPGLFTVLAEDAIRAALQDYKVKNPEKASATA
jgi:hypothetical protein